MLRSLESDILGPLGLVTLYFAYVDAELDKLIEALSQRAPSEEIRRQWPVGRKLKYAEQLIAIADHGRNDFAALAGALNDAAVLVERKNALVHRCVHMQGRAGNGTSVAHTMVSAEEITQLANSILDCNERLYLLGRGRLQPVADSRWRGEESTG